VCGCAFPCVLLRVSISVQRTSAAVSTQWCSVVSGGFDVPICSPDRVSRRLLRRATLIYAPHSPASSVFQTRCLRRRMVGWQAAVVRLVGWSCLPG
jgi:hypothetical protein